MTTDELMKPSLGKSPDFDLVDQLRAEMENARDLEIVTIKSRQD